jgi:hypothetical protein
VIAHKRTLAGRPPCYAIWLVSCRGIRSCLQVLESIGIDDASAQIRDCGALPRLTRLRVLRCTDTRDGRHGSASRSVEEARPDPTFNGREFSAQSRLFHAKDIGGTGDVAEI